MVPPGKEMIIVKVLTVIIVLFFVIVSLDVGWQIVRKARSLKHERLQFGSPWAQLKRKGYRLEQDDSTFIVLDADGKPASNEIENPSSVALVFDSLQAYAEKELAKLCQYDRKIK